MEKSPFDPPTDSSLHANLPPSCPASDNVPSLLDAPKKHSKKPLLLLLLIPFLGAGIYFYNQDQAKKAEEARLVAIRQKLKALVLADNALVLEMLETDKSSNITYSEYFKRSEKNKEERDDIVRQVRTVEADIYTPQSKRYVDLLDIENEWVRAEEALTRAQMEYSSKADAFQEAAEQRDTAQSKLKTASADYFQAPYGEDYDEKLVMTYAENAAASAQGSVNASFEAYKKAKRDLESKKHSTSQVIKEWLDTERINYPHAFAPPRDVISYLVKRKTKLGIEIGNSTDVSETVEGMESNKSPKVTITTESTSLPESAEPKPTPTPSSPTRLRSTSVFEGERFPQTRMDDLMPVDAYNLSDEDLRYAINEMFARYGMTFKDKEYQSNFEGFKWYQPNDAWTMPQIQRAFTAREKANLRVLSDERNNRNRGDR